MKEEKPLNQHKPPNMKTFGLNQGESTKIYSKKQMSLKYRMESYIIFGNAIYINLYPFLYY